MLELLLHDINCCSPAQGWTRLVHHAGRANVCSLPAGMEPTGERGQQPRHLAPRPRGDGPKRVRMFIEDMCCSPPARGWTLGTDDLAADVGLLPARAGMDPSATRSACRPTTTLRLREVGPGPFFARDQGKYCSPPAREWTPACPGHRPRAPLFPACAGMDPLGKKGAASPRCSPRLRGWTHRLQLRGLPPLLLPAPARMGPLWTWRPARWTTAPRARVAGPKVGSSHVQMVNSAPRPRGDRPRPQKNLQGTASCSPPARGWTQLTVAEAAECMLLPARAGMDPSASSTSPSTKTAPRPRGDGPQGSPCVMMFMLCSPLARGWTTGLLDEREVQELLPAGARG
ncbi:hypothetical protein M2266_006018 [Streptomyces sp. SPB162]|nr:hypothetical protein [Streptomyces sp. SPB162]